MIERDKKTQKTTEQGMNYTHCYAQFVHFFKNVCMHLGIHDWKIEFNGDNYCWMHKKTITINRDGASAYEVWGTYRDWETDRKSVV